MSQPLKTGLQPTIDQKLAVMRESGVQRLREVTEAQRPMAEETWLKQIKLFDQASGQPKPSFLKRWMRR